MAHQRSRRKRRLARLSARALVAAVAAALAGLAIAGCTETRTLGWTDAASGTRVSSLELPAASGAITVGVELPPGYEAAEEFVQRATVRWGDGERTHTQSGLDRAFRLDPPPGGEGEIELMIGFCESDVKEVCYVDTATLPVRLRATEPPDGEAAADDDAPEAAAALVYAPEAPR